MRLAEINIRDPYILPHEGKYYLYGTRGATAWSKADGFDCYISEDLENWSDPIEIFKKPADFWADQNYWAPECYAYNNQFYLITTFGAENRKKGIYILSSNHPTGPYELHAENPLTPLDWSAIDGSLYFDPDGISYLIFSRTFEDKPEGDMYFVQLSIDLKSAIGKPQLLFSAKQAPWPKPVPFALSEFGIKGDVYFTDGPCILNGSHNRLYIIWSSWINDSYGVGVAYTDDGINGVWTHVKKPLFNANGGHGMCFKTYDGKLLYTLHSPNESTNERPILCELSEKDGQLLLI